jgi:hypothetical protein
VASGLLDAAERLRASFPRDDGVERPKRPYQRRNIAASPAFEHTAFEATIFKLLSAANGDWMVTFKVPSEYREAATVLGDSYGLALDVSITRRHHGAVA